MLAKNVMVIIALFKIAAYVDLFCIVRYGMGYILHEKLDLYLCLPMWQIYSKFKFASIANTVHATLLTAWTNVAFTMFAKAANTDMLYICHIGKHE